jgi:hypothetical protein
MVITGSMSGFEEEIISKNPAHKLSKSPEEYGVPIKINIAFPSS